MFSRLWLVTAPAALCLCALASCSHAGADWQRVEACAWNTVYHVVYEGRPELADSITAVINRVDNSLSVFNHGSVVSRVNRNEEVEIDECFVEVFELSKEIAAASGGSFDPTVGPLVDLWGFGIKQGGEGAPPDSVAVDSLLRSVGIADCHLVDGQPVKKTAATRFNFSAIAKGYGCDLIGRMFRRNGVENFMIEIGGEVCLGGESRRGRDWVVQIDVPDPDSRSLHGGLLKIAVTDCGIATSGNYRNYREADGERIGHTISPLTGRPFQGDILLATVLAPATARADALATACMAMPLRAAAEMIDSSSEVEAALVLGEGAVEGDLPEGWTTVAGGDYVVVASPGFPAPVD